MITVSELRDVQEQVIQDKIVQFIGLRPLIEEGQPVFDILNNMANEFHVSDDLLKKAIEVATEKEMCRDEIVKQFKTYLSTRVALDLFFISLHFLSERGE